jgi:Putative rhamnosyl transferase
MPQLEHFVLTNFNVSRNDASRDRDNRPVDRDGDPVRTPEWLEERFALFERFCLPSLLGQTCLDFTWLMGYDAVGTPPEQLRRLRAHEASFENLRLVEEPISFRQAIADSVNTRGRRLLTTRLDSDDALHRTAIGVLQRHAGGGDPEFLNLPLGYCYSHPDGRIRLLRHESNHFLSLAENGDGGPPRTALRVSHNAASTFAPVRQIGERPSWLQVIHGCNMQNSFGGARCAPPDLKEEFNVDAPAIQATDSASGASDGAPSM